MTVVLPASSVSSSSTTVFMTSTKSFCGIALCLCSSSPRVTLPTLKATRSLLYLAFLLLLMMMRSAWSGEDPGATGSTEIVTCDVVCFAGSDRAFFFSQVRLYSVGDGGI